MSDNLIIAHNHNDIHDVLDPRIVIRLRRVGGRSRHASFNLLPQHHAPASKRWKGMLKTVLPPFCDFDSATFSKRLRSQRAKCWKVIRSGNLGASAGGWYCPGLNFTGMRISCADLCLRCTWIAIADEVLYNYNVPCQLVLIIDYSFRSDDRSVSFSSASILHVPQRRWASRNAELAFDFEKACKVINSRFRYHNCQNQC